MKKLICFFFCLACFTAKAQLPQINLVEFSTGYDLPLDLTNCGDDRIFVGEEGGKIWICKANGVKSKVYLDISKKVYNQPNFKGFMGFTFHPDYLNNGYLYVYYINKQKNSVVSRFSVSATNPNKALTSSEKIILTVKQIYGGNHYGGCLKFGPDGYLYIGMGDGDTETDPNNTGQKTNTLLGKMLRIDVDNGTTYSIPADNPFVSSVGYKKEIWALGIRNLFRYSFDRITGDLWLPDVGEDSLEEINFQPSGDPGGENYGWRCYEGSAPFNTTGCGNVSNYTFPIAEYSHNDGDCAVIGGYVYRGSTHPNMYGKYFCVDYCTGKFRMISYDGSWHNDLLNQFSTNTYVSFGEDMNGELYVVSQDEGKLFMLIDTGSAFLRDYKNSSVPESQLSIYPNPAHGDFVISYFASQQEEIKVNIYDFTGKLMVTYNQVATNGLNQIPLSSQLQPGCYVLSVQSASKTIQRKFLVE